MKNTLLLDCKNILREDKDYNIEKNILPSEVQIIDRLLTRDADMVSVYEEIHGLGLIEKQLILRGILNVGAFWNPQAAKDFRVDRKKLEDVNYKIGETAAQLAELLEAREYLHNHSGFSSDTHYCVLNALENAAEGNYLYSSYVKEKIAKLRGQYDSKYWPGVENFVLELSYDAINSTVTASDSYTYAATSSSKSSLADFFRALLKAFDELRVHNYIPSGFKFSDKSLANIANCALDLDVEKMVDAEYVKRIRQRLRNEISYPPAIN